MGSDAVPSVAVADAMGFARGLNPSYVLSNFGTGFLQSFLFWRRVSLPYDAVKTRRQTVRFRITGIAELVAD
jgi:hypothetical protein